MARKKKGGPAAHSGAWKVAYADFVTAMMALFMVLWISAQDDDVLLATSEYFQRPFSSPLDATSGLLDEQSSDTAAHSPAEEASDGSAFADPNDIDIVFLNSVAQEFYRLLNIEELYEERPIDIQITSEGLRITLFDRASKPLFQPLSAEFTDWGEFVLQNLAWMIDRHRFRVVIEGHTTRGLELPEPEYSAWDLSTDRSNAARRALTYYAVDGDQIDSVVGLADREPLPDLSPDSESNQRVTLELKPGARSHRQ